MPALIHELEPLSNGLSLARGRTLLFCAAPLPMEKCLMSAHENLEHAEHAEHASRANKKIALLIAVLALFLSLSETLGKAAQTEAITHNVETNDLWAFFQAKTIRATVVSTAAEQMQIEADRTTEPELKARLMKTIDAWNKNVARYNDEPSTGEGRKQLAERAKQAEEKRELALTRYHHYEFASAAFQIGIVLASAEVITGIAALAWLSGFLGLSGLALTAIGLWAPSALHFV
jgi:Domain of unknown function (DUF4337)